jgi:hypothetical protein
MEALFWLSVFVAVCGLGRFFIQWLVLVTGFGCSPKELMLLEVHGVVPFLSFSWFFVGLAGLIVAVNV